MKAAAPSAVALKVASRWNFQADESTPRQRPDPFLLRGPFRRQFGIACVVVVGEVKTRHHGASQQRQFSAAQDPRPLPYSCWNEQLNVLPGFQVTSKTKDSGVAIRVELEHLHWVAEIEVKHLVRVEEMHLGERSRFQQIVDGRALRAASARQIEIRRRRERAVEISALHRVRIEVEQFLYFV